MVQDSASLLAKQGGYLDSRIAIDWLRVSLPISSFSAASWLHVPADLGSWVEGRKYNKRYHAWICDRVLVASDYLPDAAGRVLDESYLDYVKRVSDTVDGRRKEKIVPRFIVDFSGEGLARWFADYGSDLTVPGFLSQVLELPGCVVNRLDVAFDDLDGLLSIPNMLRSLVGGQCVTHWREASHIESFKIGGGKDGFNGNTVYLGSRDSDNFARLYDKRLLELRRGAVPEAVPASWVRLELEIKHDRADAVARELAAQFWAPVAALELLTSVIDFKTKSGDSNVSRRSRARWWNRFVEKAVSAPVRLARPAASIERKERWIYDAVAPTIALLTEYYDSEEWLSDVVDHGAGRLREDDLHLIAGGHGV